MRREILWLTFGQMIAMFYPLIATPWLLRHLGPAGFGEVMFAFTVGLYLALVVDFGFNISGVHDIASSRHSRCEIAGVISRVVSARAVLLTVAGSIGLVLACFPSETASPPLIAIATLSLVGNLIQSGWIMQGLGMIGSLAISLAAPRVVALVLMVSVVHKPDDGPEAIALLTFPTFISALLGWYFLRRANVAWAGFTWLVSPALRSGFPSFVASIASGVLLNFGTLALGVLRSPVDVATFSGAARTVAAARSVFAPLQAVVLPRLSVGAADRDRGVRLRTSFWLLVVPHLSAGVVLFVFAPEIVSVYLGASVPGASVVVRVLSGALVLAGVEIWAYTVLVVNGSAGRAAKGYTSAAIYLLVVTLPIAELWGATGAALATASAQGICVVLLARALRVSPARGSKQSR